VVGILVGLFGAARAEPVDLNEAPIETLLTLEMLGPAKAGAWVRHRSEQGPCGSLDDLKRVPGFGAATLAALRGRAVCGVAEDGVPAAPDVAPGAPIAMPVRVDVNHAAVDELLRLPGMVLPRAEAIVADRERNGPFSSCSELVRVEGIGPATVQNFGPTCVALDQDPI
jgi:competence ComEA-like helix-hairpin-helix protein